MNGPSLPFHYPLEKEFLSVCLVYFHFPIRGGWHFDVTLRVTNWRGSKIVCDVDDDDDDVDIPFIGQQQQRLLIYFY